MGIQIPRESTLGLQARTKNNANTIMENNVRSEASRVEFLECQMHDLQSKMAIGERQFSEVMDDRDRLLKQAKNKFI